MRDLKKLLSEAATVVYPHNSELYDELRQAAEKLGEPVATCEPSEHWRERGIYRPQVTWLVAPNTLPMGKFELYLVPPTSPAPEPFVPHHTQQIDEQGHTCGSAA